MILPKVRDPRLITIRRGGTLTDSDHHLLEVKMMQARAVAEAGHAMAAARDLRGAARHAADLSAECA